jgi:hypothetical protein
MKALVTFIFACWFVMAGYAQHESSEISEMH